MLWAAAAILPLLPAGGGAPVPFDPTQAPATVVVFVSTVCPISNDYAERLNKLYSDFKDRGVGFYYVYSNHTESADAVRAHVRDLALPGFPAYVDLHNQLADRLEAQMTPTAYVLSRQGAVVYSGAIDDAVNPVRVTKPFLRFAIASVLAGQPPPVSSRPVYG